MIVLYFLPPNENFVENMLYGYDEITLDEVEAALHSNELRKQLKVVKVKAWLLKGEQG